MKFLKPRALFLAAALLAVSAAAGIAGNTTLWSSTLGDLVFPFTPTTIGDPTRGGMAPVNGSGSYFKSKGSTTGFSYTFANFMRNMMFTPAGTIAAGYTTTAPNPVDGEEECVFTTATITNFYFQASAGQTVNNAITTLTANSSACYRYSLSNLTWDREQ